jgi:hypothetical protein
VLLPGERSACVISRKEIAPENSVASPRRPVAPSLRCKLPTLIHAAAQVGKYLIRIAYLHKSKALMLKQILRIDPQISFSGEARERTEPG